MTMVSAALDALHADDKRIEGIRDAVRAVFAVGGKTDVMVRATDVFAVISEHVGRQSPPPHLRSEWRQIVVGMGAQHMVYGGASIFAAVRRHDVPLAVARRQSLELRRMLRGARLANTQRTAAAWEKQLAQEGMPAQLSDIPRPRRPRREGKRFEEDYVAADLEGRTELSVAGGGVHRQRRTTRAEMVDAALSESRDVLEEMETEIKILRLRVEGQSIRRIAVALGMDRNAVYRTLNRIHKNRFAKGEDDG